MSLDANLVDEDRPPCRPNGRFVPDTDRGDRGTEGPGSIGGDVESHSPENPAEDHQIGVEAHRPALISASSEREPSPRGRATSS